VTGTYPKAGNCGGGQPKCCVGSMSRQEREGEKVTMVNLEQEVCYPVRIAEGVREQEKTIPRLPSYREHKSFQSRRDVVVGYQIHREQ